MLAGPGLLRGKSRGGPAPTSNFDMAGGVIPAAVTFARASTATYTNYRGFLAEAPVDAARFAYDPALEYNLQLNPHHDGASVGVFPTFFSAGPFGGVTPSVVGVSDVAVSGVGTMRVIDVRLSGTTVGNNALNLGFLFTNTASCGAGENYSHQVYLAKIAGAFPAPTASGHKLRAATYDSANAYTGEVSNDANIAGLGADLTLVTQSGVTAGATTAKVNPYIQVSWTGVQTVDVTLRIGFWMATKAATQITNRIPFSTLAARNGTTPQYGLLGLLLEPTTTNGNTNPRSDGVVAGSPGTAGTGWAFNTATDGTLTRTISAIGVEDGITYYEVRYSGTIPSAAYSIIISPNSTPAAVSGQTWAASMYVRLASGTLPGSWVLRLNEVGATVFSATDVAIAPTSNALRTQRVSVTRTFTDGTTTGARPLLLSSPLASGLAVDFTLRIAYCQVEQSTWPSSVMLPPVGVPGASTRANETPTISQTLLANAQSSVAMRYAMAPGRVVAGAGAGMILSTDLGVDGPRFYPNASYVPRTTVRRGGGDQLFDTRPAALVEGEFTTTAVAWGGGSGRSGFDGEVPVEDAALTDPQAFGSPIELNGEGGTGGTGIVVRFLRLWSGVKLTPAQAQFQSSLTQ